jgi:hypothetical protein
MFLPACLSKGTPPPPPSPPVESALDALRPTLCRPPAKLLQPHEIPPPVPTIETGLEGLTTAQIARWQAETMAWGAAGWNRYLDWVEQWPLLADCLNRAETPKPE